MAGHHGVVVCGSWVGVGWGDTHTGCHQQRHRSAATCAGHRIPVDSWQPPPPQPQAVMSGPPASSSVDVQAAHQQRGGVRPPAGPLAPSAAPSHPQSRQRPGTAAGHLAPLLPAASACTDQGGTGSSSRGSAGMRWQGTRQGTQGRRTLQSHSADCHPQQAPAADGQSRAEDRLTSPSRASGGTSGPADRCCTAAPPCSRPTASCRPRHHPHQRREERRRRCRRHWGQRRQCRR